MTTLPPDIATPPPLDPGQEVPAEYEVFCEGCGYSLIGIATDRCPECGATFDPTALPFARVPWLHRQRLGRFRAYCSTVWMVLTGPRTFARELCRPVRISAADARAFRLLTVRIASLSVAVAVAGVLAVLVRTAPPIPGWAWPAMGFVVLLAYLSTRIFLSLATDMPTFIWRGLPSRPASELAPVHHYAAAPLALMPLAAIATILAAAFVFSLRDPDLFFVAAAAVGLVMLVVSWLVALGMMSGATQGGPWRRVALLALYLPVHWLMLAFLVWMLTGAVILGVTTVLQVLKVL